MLLFLSIVFLAYSLSKSMKICCDILQYRAGSQDVTQEMEGNIGAAD